jgi:hypothetical protein
VRTVSQHPEINRYIINKQFFSRNNCTVSFTMLKDPTRHDSEETAVKIKFDLTDTIFDVRDRMIEQIEKNRVPESKNFLDKLPLTFVLTVMAQQDDEDIFKGIFIGKERDSFEQAVALSEQVNINHVEKPVKKCVVWMDPHSYHSTWVTNKAFYRTMKMVQEGGEIIVIAPGLHVFGENDLADQAIRKYGYRPREEILELYKNDPLLSGNMSLAGHLIRCVPSMETRLTYCTDQIPQAEIEHAGFHYMSVSDAMAAYPCEDWQTGWKTLPNGEEIYFVRNAALGLWQFDGLYN